jgi:hypothetical protein
MVDATRLLRNTPVWVFGAARLAVLLGPVHGRSPVLVDFFVAPQYGIPVQQAGPSFTLPLPQQSPPSTPWFGEWDPQSLTSCLSSTAPPLPPPPNTYNQSF